MHLNQTKPNAATGIFHHLETFLQALLRALAALPV